MLCNFLGYLRLTVPETPRCALAKLPAPRYHAVGNFTYIPATPISQLAFGPGSRNLAEYHYKTSEDSYQRLCLVSSTLKRTGLSLLKS